MTTAACTCLGHAGPGYHGGPCPRPMSLDHTPHCSQCPMSATERRALCWGSHCPSFDYYPHPRRINCDRRLRVA